jgi:hypothetical protein
MENQKKTGLGERIALLESDNSEPVRAGKDEMLRTLHSLAGAPLAQIYRFREPDNAFAKDPWAEIFSNLDGSGLISVDPGDAEERMNLAEFGELIRIDEKAYADEPYYSPDYVLLMDVLRAVAQGV